jgi:phage gpG-like protein
MSISIRLTKDEITPDLRRKLRAVSSPGTVLLAAGTEIVSITKRSFRDPSLRQHPWPAKKTGEPSNLIAKGMLVSSIRVVNYDDKQVTTGSDRKYAAIHQLGGVIKAKGKPLVFRIGGKLIFANKVTMPPRPFFPFTREGRLASFAVPKVIAVMDKAMRRLLGGR